ncbi:hypothetical protein B0T18DRAFT_155982 [Schizothecium vesticola]|uniref:Uncharacterized protein n=1 Tax=Schizothecium vesticola TaxID=314040 RepID=A0AA40EWH6_9PEZI|nr:hypothetical protein B0T18DRAFT_155982 [Schizothecium vesticola]
MEPVLILFFAAADVAQPRRRQIHTPVTITSLGGGGDLLVGPAPPRAAVSTPPSPSGERGGPTDSSAGYMLNSHTTDKSIVTMMRCTHLENFDIHQPSLAPPQNAREHSRYLVRMGTSLPTRATHVSFARTDFRAGAGAGAGGRMDGWMAGVVSGVVSIVHADVHTTKISGLCQYIFPFIDTIYASTYPPAIYISSAHALQRDGGQARYVCRLPRYLSAGSIRFPSRTEIMV